MSSPHSPCKHAMAVSSVQTWSSGLDSSKAAYRLSRGIELLRSYPKSYRRVLAQWMLQAEPEGPPCVYGACCMGGCTGAVVWPDPLRSYGQAHTARQSSLFLQTPASMSGAFVELRGLS